MCEEVYVISDSFFPFWTLFLCFVSQHPNIRPNLTDVVGAVANLVAVSAADPAVVPSVTTVSKLVNFANQQVRGREADERTREASV